MSNRTQTQNIPRQKLLLSAAVFICLSAVVLSVWKFYAHSNRQSEIEHVRQMAETTAHVLADRTANIMHSYISSLRIASQSPPMQKFRRTPEEAVADVGALLEHIARESPGAYKVRFIDQNGMEMIRADKTPDGGARLFPQEELQPKDTRYFFINTMKLQEGQVYISPLDLNMEHDEVQIPWVPTIRVATPISFDGENNHGVFMYNFYADNLLSIFDRLSKDGNSAFMLVNEDGYWLTGRPEEELWGFMFDKDHGMHSAFPEIWAEIRKQPQSFIHRNGAFWSAHSIALQDYLPADQRYRIVSEHHRWYVVTRTTLPVLSPFQGRGLGVTVALGALLLLLSWFCGDSLIERRNAKILKQAAERDLVRAEKMALLGRMVAGVAHELSTPIGNAVTTASTLSDMVEEIEEEIAGGQLKKSSVTQFIGTTKNGCTLILRGLERASEMLKSFKQIAVDQTSEKKRSFALDDYIEEIAATLRPHFSGTNVVLVTDLSANMTVDSYPGVFSQVLMNIVRNALLHGFPDKQKGRVKITSRALEDDMAEICIYDDGQGIPDDAIRHIFEPFFTTKGKIGGSGLGLSIARSIVVDILGGEISAISSPEKNFTVFRIIIPKTAPDATEHDTRNIYDVTKNI